MKVSNCPFDGVDPLRLALPPKRELFKANVPKSKKTLAMATKSNYAQELLMRQLTELKKNPMIVFQLVLVTTVTFSVGKL